ncbi:MAG: HXXEE domain-containing protein [Acidobacteriota bacterium]|nr:HXXEE domain-containing protein [Acidobacteriota bacterium]
MDEIDDKIINRLYFLLPFVFSFHNFEEVLGMEAWSKKLPLPIHPVVTTKQFAVGAVLITVIGFLITFSKSFFKSKKSYNFLMTAFAGMIFLNVFLPHLLATIVFGGYAPGVVTALLINLPLTLYISLVNIKSGNLTLKQTISFILYGGLVGVPLAFLLLKIGEILS